MQIYITCICRIAVFIYFYIFLFRKQVEHILNKKDDEGTNFDEYLDVDEEVPPKILGYCTPIKLEEEDDSLPIRYLKSSKPIEVDSVWDTIIEEEEDECEEVMKISS